MTIQFNYHWNGQDGIKTLSTVEEARLVSLGIARYYTPYMDGGPSDAGARSLEIHPSAGLLSGGAAPTPSQLNEIRGARNALQSRSGGLMDPASWSAHSLCFRAADQTTLADVYWPWVIRADEHIVSPLGKYYLYYSSDHGTGGFAMAYSNDLAGPWAPHGKVYGDTESTEEGETPSVVWDETISKYRMFYHCNGAKYNGGASSALGIQSTLSATSTNGIAWTKDPAFVIDIPGANQTRGDGHTGYFLPFSTGAGDFAHSLLAGSDSSDTVIWRMGRNTAEWKSDYVSLGYGYEATNAIATFKKIERNASFVVTSGGVDYLISLATDGVSGSAAKNARIIASKISRNYRTIIGQPVIIWEPDEAWETSDIRSLTPFVEDNVLHVFYSIAKTHIGVFSHVL